MVTQPTYDHRRIECVLVCSLYLGLLLLVGYSISRPILVTCDHFKQYGDDITNMDIDSVMNSTVFGTSESLQKCMQQSSPYLYRSFQIWAKLVLGKSTPFRRLRETRLQKFFVER